MKPLEEFGNAGKDFVPMVDHAVHIADKAFFLIKVNGIYKIHYELLSLLDSL